MRSTVLLAAFLTFLCSCGQVKEHTKEAISKTGETVGRGSSEFVKGLSDGIDRTLQCTVELRGTLAGKGVDRGKFKISNSPDGHDNVLTSYLVFNQDFHEVVTVKVFDQNNQEYGRIKVPVEGKAGDARFIDFTFDKRTEIESKSRFVIE